MVTLSNISNRKYNEYLSFIITINSFYPNLRTSPCLWHYICNDSQSNTSNQNVPIYDINA